MSTCVSVDCALLMILPFSAPVRVEEAEAVRAMDVQSLRERLVFPAGEKGDWLERFKMPFTVKSAAGIHLKASKAKGKDGEEHPVQQDKAMSTYAATRTAMVWASQSAPSFESVLSSTP